MDMARRPYICNNRYTKQMQHLNLAGYALCPPPPKDRADLVDSLRQDGFLVLDTCQRLEAFGIKAPNHEIHERWSHSEAFSRLVRVATGLESRILGELEVLGQVRNAYKRFHAEHRSNEELVALDRLFQDVLALARKARKESGIDRNLTSLSGLAAREMIERVPEGAPIAVIGSGTLAGSVIRYLGKRGKSPVRVGTRCPEKAMQLALSAGGFGTGLDDLAHLLDGVAGVITATAAPHPVLYAHHLPEGYIPLHVIDMGVPPDCCEATASHENVSYLSLQDIEAKSETNLVDRQKAAERAREIIRAHIVRIAHISK